MNENFSHAPHKHYNNIDIEIWPYGDGNYGIVYRKRISSRVWENRICESLDVFKGDWDSAWIHACKLREIARKNKQNIRRNVKITDNFVDVWNKHFKLGRWMDVFYSVYFVDNGVTEERFKTYLEARLYIHENKHDGKQRDINFQNLSRYS